MSEPLPRIAPEIAVVEKGGVRLAPAAPRARHILRGVEAPAVAGVTAGVEIPTEPCRAARQGERVVLWLGPDEWLVLLPEAEAGGVARALQPHAGSLVDVSHRQIGLTLSGKGAALALSGGVPLDLAPAAFPVGMAVRTLFAKAEIILWRSGEQEFHIEVARSFAPYLRQSLELILRQNAAQQG